MRSLTAHEILSLRAGPDLDRRVAARVMGQAETGAVPSYSRERQFADQVLKRMLALGYEFRRTGGSPLRERCYFQHRGRQEAPEPVFCPLVLPDPLLAVCRAALLAVTWDPV